jgi:hypothetical protein
MESEWAIWLEEMTDTFSREGVEPYQRPWEAMRRLSLAKGISIDFSSPLAKFIFEWFKQRSHPSTYLVGTQYTSAYYYDHTFWRVEIPIVLGQAVIQPEPCLKEMPEPLMVKLRSDPAAWSDYAVWWADCVDYGSGIREVEKPGLDKFGLSLMYAADQELRNAITVLLDPRGNARALLMLRFVVEMFLKSILALEVGLTEKQAIEISHDLHKAFSKFVELKGYELWRPVEPQLGIFPPVTDRYEKQDVEGAALWKAMQIAQSLGTTIVRKKTDRNAVGSVLAQLQKMGFRVGSRFS